MIIISIQKKRKRVWKRELSVRRRGFQICFVISKSITDEIPQDTLVRYDLKFILMVLGHYYSMGNSYSNHADDKTL